MITLRIVPHHNDNNPPLTGRQLNIIGQEWAECSSFISHPKDYRQKRDTASERSYPGAPSPYLTICKLMPGITQFEIMPKEKHSIFTSWARMASIRNKWPKFWPFFAICSCLLSLYRGYIKWYPAPPSITLSFIWLTFQNHPQMVGYTTPPKLMQAVSVSLSCFCLNYLPCLVRRRRTLRRTAASAP